MALKRRSTGLGSAIDEDRPDYTVFTGKWKVGRIYETRGGPDSLRWFWSMTVNGPMTRSDRVATPEEAKAQFQKSWDAWKAWAKPTRCGSGMGPPAAKDGGAPRKRTRQQPGGQRAPGSRVR